MRRHPAPRTINLTNTVWAAADLGEVRVGTATIAVATLIDQAWLPRRDGDDIHLAWRWADIVPDMREAFVVQAGGEPIAIWVSKSGSPIVLAGQFYYRLEYLEVDPARRGDGQTSALLLGLIAKRAAEHRADGVILAGWNHPSHQLVPLTFKQPALTRLRELIDDFEEKFSGPLP